MNHLEGKARCIKITFGEPVMVFVDSTITDEMIKELYHDYYNEVYNEDGFSTNIADFIAFINDKYQNKDNFFFAEIMYPESEITL